MIRTGERSASTIVADMGSEVMNIKAPPISTEIFPTSAWGLAIDIRVVNILVKLFYKSSEVHHLCPVSRIGRVDS